MSVSAEERKIIDSLRDQGYAVTIFTPEELAGADPEEVEDRMVESGWHAIDFFQ